MLLQAVPTGLAVEQEYINGVASPPAVPPAEINAASDAGHGGILPGHCVTPAGQVIDGGVMVCTVTHAVSWALQEVKIGLELETLKM